MKVINIAHFKAHLSKYLRSVHNGERVVVVSRKEPIAEIIPIVDSQDPWERLAREGKIILGSQAWKNIKNASLRHRVPIQEILKKVRED